MNFTFFHHLGFLTVLGLGTVACSGGMIEDDGAAGGTPATGGGQASGGASGGSGSATGGSGATGTYCDFTPIMQDKCDGPACHGAPGQEPLLYTDFFNPPDGQTVGQMLLGKEADYSFLDPEDQVTCASPPEQLINPTAPAESLMLKKVMGTQSCGGQMPDQNGLPQTEVECLTEWINGIVANGM